MSNNGILVTGSVNPVDSLPSKKLIEKGYGVKSLNRFNFRGKYEK